MATTLEGRRLTEAHRLAQVRLRALVVLQMRNVWHLLDPADLDATVERWLTAAQPVVAAGHTQSARLAATYANQLSVLETGSAAGITVTDIPLASSAVQTSLLVTGPANLKSKMGQLTLAQASTEALAAAAEAAARHALTGGRQAIEDFVRADQRATGWARVTGPSPCAFCSMLAGRGPVYRESTVRFQAHDHCACTAEPMWTDEWPQQAVEFRRLWKQVTAGHSGPDALNAWRRYVESR